MNQIQNSKFNSFVSDIRNIITNARKEAIRSVEFYRVKMYWEMGERIFLEEQEGKERAEYGTYLIQNLAKVIESEYGSGFSYRTLAQCRQFYRTYPIVNAVRSQLNWSQYRLLITMKDEHKREFYELEAVKNAWNGKELERQVHASLYERLLMSSDKDSVMAVARNEKLPEHPSEIIKSPMLLEFLGLEKMPHYYEKDLENALITNLQQFMLELGNGFSFVARQKRLVIEDDEFFADLFFYNRLLRCFVVIELKTQKMTHQDLGQLQMYVNYYDRFEKLPDEKPTIGILLCQTKNAVMVELTLPKDTSIYATKYSLYLPEKKLLEEKLTKWTAEFGKDKYEEI